MFELRRRWWCVLAVLAAVAAGVLQPAAGQQLTPDEMAAQLLDASRRAYNEKNHPFAIENFRKAA